MFFKQLATKESSLSYFLGCGSLGKAIAVDVVAGDEEWFMDEAAKANVTITHVIDTHVHADHYSGGRTLAKLAGAKYCLHESDKGLVKFDFTPLTDNETIEAGNVVVKVVHTPGHTLDSICLAVADKRRSEQPWFIITGDTLFVGGVNSLACKVSNSMPAISCSRPARSGRPTLPTNRVSPVITNHG